MIIKVEGQEQDLESGQRDIASHKERSLRFHSFLSYQDCSLHALASL